MAGTAEGAQKAKQKNLEKDPDFYSNIGKRSWSNPDRSHETGFANVDPELRREYGRKGGKKTKNDYKKKITIKTETTYFDSEEEALAFLQQALRDSTDLSE